jgi:hypothetical protein
MPDPDPTEAEVTIITRIVKSGLIERLIPLLISALLGGTAGMASRQVGDAEHNATVEANRAEILALDAKAEAIAAEYKDFKTKYYERLRENRERADAEHAALDHEQRQAEKYLERRLTRIEFKLGMEAPPAPPAAVEAPPQ